MPDITFACPHCTKLLVIDSAGAGTSVTCPQCQNVISVPGSRAVPLPPPPAQRLDVDFGRAYGMEPASDLGIGDAFAQFKALDYGFLVPIKKIFSADLLRRRAVRWILLFGTLPLVFSWMARQFHLSFNEVLWLLLLYFCFFWALYFYSLVQPSRENWMRGIGYALFTVVVGLPLLFASHKLPFIRDFYSSDISRLAFLSRSTGFVVIVGVLEETCKALPLLIFGLRGKRIRGVRDGVFLGLMSGFGFAASEGFSYVYGATATAIDYGGGGAASAQLLTILDRVVSGPLQHATWAGIVGWFIGVAALKTTGPRWPIVVVGIGLTAVLHGLFDTFSSGLTGILLALVGYLAFMGYLIHGEEEKQATGTATNTSGAAS